MKLRKPVNIKKLLVYGGLSVVILFLLFLVVAFSFEYSDLESENARLAADNTRLATELSAASAKANAIEEINRNISSAIDRLEAFKQDVADTTKWFKDNSNIAGVKEYDIDRSVFEERCLIFDKQTCRIKLGCPGLVFETVNYFSYKPDKETSNKTDYMQDLGSFYRNMGGDCEDYSIAVSASLNYIQDYCAKYGATNFNFEAIVKGTGTTYFIDKTESWYYKDASKYDIPQDYVHHYVVCGDFPFGVDPNIKDGQNYSGHCVLAFTNIPVTGSASIRDSLKDSILVEPQNGFLVYDLRYDDSVIVPYNGYAYYDMRNLIYSVITDNDYYIFKRYGNDAYWVGYKDFYPLIDGMEGILEQIKTGVR